jgi:hypothetical protein
MRYILEGMMSDKEDIRDATGNGCQGIYQDGGRASEWTLREDEYSNPIAAIG